MYTNKTCDSRTREHHLSGIPAIRDTRCEIEGRPRHGTDGAILQRVPGGKKRKENPQNVLKK